MVEKSDEFDEWQAIRQVFPSNLFHVNTFPMKTTINSKVSDMLDSSEFFTVTVLHYTV